MAIDTANAETHVSRVIKLLAVGIASHADDKLRRIAVVRPAGLFFLNFLGTPSAIMATHTGGGWASICNLGPVGQGDRVKDPQLVLVLSAVGVVAHRTANRAEVGAHLFPAHRGVDESLAGVAPYARLTPFTDGIGERTITLPGVGRTAATARY